MFNAKTNNSENSYNQSSYVYQIGKGLLLFGGGILGYLGLSKIFGSGPQDEQSEVFKDEIVSYKSNKLTLNNFEPTLLSSFNLNPTSRKLLSIDAEEEQQSQQRRLGFTGIPGYRWTDEFQVNSYTTSNQGYGGLSVSVLSGNKFVALWSGFGQGGGGQEIFGRMFNSTGYPLNEEFRVNSYTTSSQGLFGLSTSALSKDKFVVLWNSNIQDGDGFGVFGRVFNSTGYPLTNEFQVNSYTTSEQGYCGLSVSALSADKFVVLWNSNGQDGHDLGVFGRVFNSAGEPLTGEFQTNNYTAFYQGAYGLAVTVLSENKFVGLWNSYGQDGDYSGVFGRVFNFSGHALTNEFQVNSYTTSYQGDAISACALSGDKFVVLWDSDGQDGSGYGVLGRMFDSAGNALTNEFRVNSYTTSDQGRYDISVSVLSGEKFVVLWGSDGQDGNSYGVFGRIFNGTGYPLTDEFQINGYTLSYQGYYGLSVSTLSENKFVALWNSDGQDGDGYGVFGRAFISNSCPVLLNNELTIKKGENVFVNKDVLLADDADDSEENLVITTRTVFYGRFERATLPGAAINTFTQSEVNTNMIRFVHDGSDNSPDYEVSVSDGVCTTPWFGANIIFDNAINNVTTNTTTNTTTSTNTTIDTPGGSDFPYGYLILGGGSCVALTILCITITGICAASLLSKNTEKEIDFSSVETKREMDSSSVEEEKEIKLLPVEKELKLGNFLNKYKIPYNKIKPVKYIGRGATATVYKAKWENQDVAYKVFTGGVTSEEIRKFEAEAKIMLGSDHPNVVKLHGVCIDKNRGTFGLLMEYMEMGTLHDVLLIDDDKAEKLSWQSKWNIAYDLAVVLKFLHGKNVFHRDIKAENVLLYKESDGIHAKIADFGLSRNIETSQTITMSVGTYKYMAPEVVVGDERYDIGKSPMDKVDIYALGMTYVVLITEQELYPNEDSCMSIPARVSQKKLVQKISKYKCPLRFFNLTNECRDLDLEKRPSADKIVAELEDMKKNVISFVPIVLT